MLTNKRRPKTKSQRPEAQNEGGNDSIPFASENSLEPSRIVELFTQEFKHILESPDLNEFIQEVKGQLYNREYISAFNSDDKRFAYASRWTPARALSYSSLFGSLSPIVELLEESESQKKVLCVGGGAAGEVIGLAAVFCRLKELCSTSDSSLLVDVVDIADWSKIVNNLTNYMKRTWIYKPEKLSANFINSDILTDEYQGYGDLDLITLLFTTNELFAEKKTDTIKFLQKLNHSCKSGSLLLIAESAGSYSHITIGTKKFPVQFMIDMILLGKQGENNGAWELVEQSDSCWYRIDEKEIEYPMKLENMRFFYRLYQKK